MQIPLFEQFGAENAEIAQQMAAHEFRYAPARVRAWAAQQYMKRLAGRSTCQECRQVPGTVHRIDDDRWLCCNCAGVSR